MPSLWSIVTENSTLEVQTGNSFWNHLNNQSGEGGGTVIRLVEGDFIAEEQVIVGVGEVLTDEQEAALITQEVIADESGNVDVAEDATIIEVLDG